MRPVDQGVAKRSGWFSDRQTEDWWKILMLDRLHLAARAPAAYTLDHHNKQLLLIGNPANGSLLHRSTCMMYEALFSPDTVSMICSDVWPER